MEKIFIEFIKKILREITIKYLVYWSKAHYNNYQKIDKIVEQMTLTGFFEDFAADDTPFSGFLDLSAFIDSRERYFQNFIKYQKMLINL